MYAIRSKRTKKWLYGTKRYYPIQQLTSNNMVKIYPDYYSAKVDFLVRRCGKSYEIVPVRIEEVKGEEE